ncbi:MAG: 50S ribosomal protein L3 [Pirellulaceae bacterium]
MTQIYDETGQAIPVTVLEAGPCHVLQVRSVDRDGYEAVQLGYLDKPRRSAIRSEQGHVANIKSKRSRVRSAAGVEAAAKADCEPKRFVREIRGAAGDLSVGTEVKVDVLAECKAVDVVGVSKGRGYSGPMKRHNFAGQRASHGVKKVHRHPGGTGCSAFPSRTFKGKKMAGQYGNARVTARNLKVVRVDADNNLLLVRGAVPGPNGGFVVIRETNMVK